MKYITLTPILAYAAGRDAGNAAMRKAGRKRWSPGDYNKAIAVTNKLMDALAKG